MMKIVVKTRLVLKTIIYIFGYMKNGVSFVFYLRFSKSLEKTMYLERNKKPLPGKL